MNINPEIVLDAVTDSEKTFGGITIHDISILRYAYLEMAGSPFVDASVKFEIGSIAPSIFILAAEKQELRKYGRQNIDQLKTDALEWCDENLSIKDFPAIISEITSRFTAMNEAAPDAVSDSKKK